MNELRPNIYEFIYILSVLIVLLHLILNYAVKKWLSIIFRKYNYLNFIDYYLVDKIAIISKRPNHTNTHEKFVYEYACRVTRKFWVFIINNQRNLAMNFLKILILVLFS